MQPIIYVSPLIEKYFLVVKAISGSLLIDCNWTQLLTQIDIWQIDSVSSWLIFVEPLIRIKKWVGFKILPIITFFPLKNC